VEIQHKKRSSTKIINFVLFIFLSAPRPIASDPFSKRFGGAEDTGEARLSGAFLREPGSQQHRRGMNVDDRL
jgi:hypothetical protein